MEVLAQLAQQGIALSDQQAAAVCTDADKVLLLAVPGAGKTTVVAARAGRLILEQQTPAEQLLILTYNRTAVLDMQRRWQQFFGEQVPSPAFSTIHSFCYRLLHEYARGRGSSVPRLIEGEEAGRGRVVSGIYRELTGQFLPEDQLGRFLNLMGYCTNLRISPEEAVRAYPGEMEQFPELFARYTAYKREQGVMDFDDMQLFAYTALARSKQLQQRVAARYQQVMVDEAQDTSRLQQEIIAMVTDRQLFMVGDEDQSIYGFRGAYPKGLLGFFEQYGDGKLLKLEQNYRSTPELVSAAATLIAHNTQRYQKNIFTERPAGSAPAVVTDIPLEKAYRAIAEQAAKLSQNSHVAVLYRTSFSGIGVALELAALGADYSASESRLSYSSDFVTRDISNILRLGLAPGDAQAFRQVYFRLGCGLSRDIERLASAAPRDDILQWIADNADTRERNTARILYTRRLLAKMAKKRPVYQIDDIIEELGYLDTLEKRGPSGYLMSSYVQRLCIIRRLAQDCADAQQLLERLASAEQLLQRKGYRPIRLSTVHAAKGQEYDHVLLVDALEGIFPDADAVEYSTLGSREQPEEEARLFYTAMTRARDSLTIYAPAEGLGRELLQSRFVAMAGLGGGTVSVGALREGVDVSHTFFGAGRITEVNLQRHLVTVQFRHYGSKSFGIETFDNPKLFKIFQ